jgi:hypothetical protein
MRNLYSITTKQGAISAMFPSSNKRANEIPGHGPALARHRASLHILMNFDGDRACY